MATTTLSRRIRRIGLLHSSYSADGSNRVFNYDPEMTDKGRQFIEDGLRTHMKSLRAEMRKSRGVKPAPKAEAVPAKTVKSKK